MGIGVTYAGPDGSALRPSTIRQLLRTALEPVGRTMYVWGGGWNREDTGAGETARTIGVPERWEQFFREQTAAYDFTKTRFQIEDGLDCSGYVGWVLYNLFYTENGHEGFVMAAEEMASAYASWGWGEYTPPEEVTDYRAGDIMSKPHGHVYITLGSCEDGSVVLLHASPPGVMISGTPAKGGEGSGEDGRSGFTSQALELARTYMQRYYPEWYERYPQIAREAGYRTQFGRMRWNLGDTGLLSDPDGYTELGAAEILKDLYSERP